MSSPAPQQVDSPSNHGPIVGVMTWFLLAATVCAVIARVATKLAISRRFTSDDLLIFAALVRAQHSVYFPQLLKPFQALSIGQGVVVTLQIGKGLGKHADTLSGPQLDRFDQFDYASNLLFIVNLCLAKVSVLQMLRTITPVKLHVRMVLGVGLFILLWSLASEFVAAFQCSMPRPWQVTGNRCLDRTAFWNAYGFLNLITEAALLLLPLIIVWKIQTKLKKKAVIFLCFASRIVVLGAIVGQLVYQNRAASTNDRTFKMWPVVLMAQTVQSLSIITACVPCLKPFLESLESGMLRTDDLRRRGMNGAYGYGSHNLTNLSARSNGKKEKSQIASNASAGKHYKLPNNISTVVSVSRNEDAERDSDSQKSSARIIKYTRTFSVE
ncbi:MAG: hypothetical protein LQ349_003911 [Xanthoria aureola]|nr:MAG: hypothetical protein LQ349_003911 [Xanthoria aureola]